MDREMDREMLKKEAMKSLWDRGWTEKEISYAVSKSMKYVEEVLHRKKGGKKNEMLIL